MICSNPSDTLEGFEHWNYMTGAGVLYHPSEKLESIIIIHHS